MKDFIIQYWLEELFGAVVILLGIAIKIIHKKVKKTYKKTLALANGVESIIRTEIIRMYEKSIDRGYCPIYAKDALEKQYNAYHDLGGNGTITQLFNEIMELPTEEELHRK